MSTNVIAEYPGIRIEYSERPRGYTVNGLLVPSVTTVIGIRDKSKQLVPWAARMTQEGIWKLLHRETYELPTEPPETCPWSWSKRHCKDPATGCRDGDPLLCQFKMDLKAAKLDHYAQTQRGADRGLDLHTVLEDWIERQTIPNPEKHRPAHRGYMRALVQWLAMWRPTFYESEMIVGSARHGFAGRRDTVAVVDVANLPARVVSHPRFPDAARDGGLILMDLKTTKDIYPETQYPQLAAYELAGVECGAKPTVAQAIVQIGADGKYKVGWSNATAEDFLALLGAYKSQTKWGKP